MAQRRVSSDLKSWADQIRDQILRRAIDAEAVSASEATFAVSRLDGLFVRLDELLERHLVRLAGSDGTIALSAMRDQIYKRLVQRAAELIEGEMQVLGERWASRLTRLGEKEAAGTVRALTASTPRGITFDVSAPNPQTIRAILNTRPMQGKILRDTVKDWGKTTRAKVMAQINLGIAQGRTVPQIKRAVLGVRVKAGHFDGPIPRAARREAEAIAITATSHVTNEARSDVYKANADVLDRVLWSSTLDTRTSDICKGLDQKSWPVTSNYPRPPAHFRCRSVLLPVPKSAQALGLKIKSLDEVSREMANGKPPTKVNYWTWIKDQPRGAQDAALGPGRAEILRRGVVPVDRFANKNGKTLSLAELKELESRLLSQRKAA